MTEQYKFQKLRVYQSALDYVDAIYALSLQLPDNERYNLKTQLRELLHLLFLILPKVQRVKRMQNKIAFWVMRFVHISKQLLVLI